MCRCRFLHRLKSPSGFTLIEVVAVLLVLGVLLVVAVTRYSTGNASAIAEAEVFKSCLRYAQVRAMGDISTWGITITSSSSYSLFSSNPSITNPILPGVGGTTRTLPAGVTMSGANTSIIFDYRGRPVGAKGVEYQKNAAVANWPAPLGSNTTITFTGDSAVNVVVMQQTGFVQ